MEQQYQKLNRRPIGATLVAIAVLTANSGDGSAEEIPSDDLTAQEASSEHEATTTSRFVAPLERFRLMCATASTHAWSPPHRHRHPRSSQPSRNAHVSGSLVPGRPEIGRHVIFYRR